MLPRGVCNRIVLVFSSSSGVSPSTKHPFAPEDVRSGKAWSLNTLQGRQHCSAIHTDRNYGFKMAKLIRLDLGPLDL